MKILMVEDNKINADILSNRLRRHKYEVDIAEDGRIGLDMSMQEGKYFVALVDINLPYYTGWQVVRAIRDKDRPYFQELKIFMLSACVFPDDKKKAKEFGANCFIEKPIDFAFLLKNIQSIQY